MIRGKNIRVTGSILCGCKEGEILKISNKYSHLKNWKFKKKYK